MINISEQGGEVESRWAHNSKVGGSKPLSASFFIINKLESKKIFVNKKGFSYF